MGFTFVPAASANIPGDSAAFATIAEEPYKNSLRFISSSPCIMRFVLSVMLSIVAVADEPVAHVWAGRNTFGWKRELQNYFDSREISANIRFITRGENPDARRRWRARWL